MTILITDWIDNRTDDTNTYRFTADSSKIPKISPVVSSA